MSEAVCTCCPCQVPVAEPAALVLRRSEPRCGQKVLGAAHQHLRCLPAPGCALPGVVHTAQCHAHCPVSCALPSVICNLSSVMHTAKCHADLHSVMRTLSSVKHNSWCRAQPSLCHAQPVQCHAHCPVPSTLPGVMQNCPVPCTNCPVSGKLPGAMRN